MRDRKDVVLADSRRVAQTIMNSDWQWTPQRVKDALIVTNKGQLALLKGNTAAVNVYVAGDYPSSDYDVIHLALANVEAVWSNPFAGETMISLRTAQRAS